MTVDRGRRRIAAPPQTIAVQLRRPLDLPGWNPLFASLTGGPDPTVGTRYELTLRLGLRGTFAYSALDDDRIGMTWEVPGMREDCTWTIAEAPDGGSSVTHVVERSGPLAAVLSGATRGIADLRLDRLATIVGAVTT